jgi:hypothetical protein
MLIIETVLELAALCILGRYLWRKHIERLGRQLERTLSRAQWTGVGFDPALLRPRLESLRQDYTAGLALQVRKAARKPRLVCLARKVICGLSYFRERLPPDPKHDSPIPAHRPQSAAVSNVSNVP